MNWESSSRTTFTNSTFEWRWRCQCWAGSAYMLHNFCDILHHSANCMLWRHNSVRTAVVNLELLSSYRLQVGGDFKCIGIALCKTWLTTLKKCNTITTWQIQLTKKTNAKVMSSNFKLVSQLSRALGTDEDLTLLAVALVVISAGDHLVFGGVDLVVPGGSHPAQRQDLSAGLCCRLLRRLLPLPPSNLPRPRYSHLSGEDFFYHILITFPLYRLQLNTLMEWTIMRKNWEVSWVELNGFQTEWSLHFFQLSRLVNYMYWLSSLWTVKYRMHGTRVQGCSIIWSLGWFF